MARNPASNLTDLLDDTRKVLAGKSSEVGVKTGTRPFLKLREVMELTTLSTSEIYRRIAKGTFPRQVMLGPKSAVWIEAEVLAWCDDRIREREIDVYPLY